MIEVSLYQRETVWRATLDVERGRVTVLLRDLRANDETVHEFGWCFGCHEMPAGHMQLLCFDEHLAAVFTELTELLQQALLEYLTN